MKAASVFEERLQAALAGFRLIGSVGRVEFAATRDRIDCGRNEMIVRSAAEEARPGLLCISFRQELKLRFEFQLGQCPR